MTIAVIWQRPRAGEGGVCHAWAAWKQRVKPDDPPLCGGHGSTVEQWPDGTLRCIQCEQVAAIVRDRDLGIDDA